MVTFITLLDCVRNRLWGSISYAVKALDIPPMKTEDLERTTLGPTQAGGSEAENNMCMCVL
jgi:hypothetical protein